MWEIERTPQEDQAEALMWVVGAGQIGPEVEAGARTLSTYMAEEAHGRCALWWIRQGDDPLAAALVVVSPGRTAMILHSSADGGEVAVEPLGRLLGTLADETLSDRVVLLQALLSPPAHDDVQAFTAAGFTLLARLVYMRQSLRGRYLQMPAEAPKIECRHYNARRHADFASVILASYQDSLDCPRLEGLRSIEDVLSGHKASGIFRADLWTIAYCQGRPAGVVLMNENVTQNAAEIVYMGVAKPFRGKRIGGSLLVKAAQLAGSNRFGALCLAVDFRNYYAQRLYLRAGFVTAFERLAYVRARRSDADTEEGRPSRCGQSVDGK